MQLNQAHIGCRPAHARFLRIDLVQIVSTCVGVSVSVSEAINNNWVIWTLYDWLNKFCSCYMATVAIIINGCVLGIDMHHGN